MANRRQKTPARPVTKAEFVCAMLELARVDREIYRTLRSEGWEHARSLESDIPN